jgi:hypothetical protein
MEFFLDNKAEVYLLSFGIYKKIMQKAKNIFGCNLLNNCVFEFAIQGVLSENFPFSLL